MTTVSPARSHYLKLIHALYAWAERRGTSPVLCEAESLVILGQWLAENDPDIIDGFLSWLETQ